MVATLLTPGYLRWDGSKFVTDPTVEIVGPPGPPGPPGSGGGSVTAWQAYTPLFTDTGDDASLGGGTILGQWRTVNDSVELMLIINIGSGTSFGSTNFLVALPEPKTVMTLDTSKCLLGSDGYYHLSIDITLGIKDTASGSVLGSNNSAFNGPTQYDAFDIALSDFIGLVVSGDMLILRATIPVVMV